MARLILSEDNPEPEAIPELEILVPSDAGDVGLFYEVTVRVKSTYSGDVQVLVRGGGNMVVAGAHGTGRRAFI